MAHKKEGKERILDPRVDRIWEYMREKKMNLKKLVDVTKLSYPADIAVSVPSVTL